MSGNVIPSLAAGWAIRVTLIAAATTTVLKLLRIRQARARHLAWSLIVVLSLLMPVVRQWTPPIPLRILPAVPDGAFVHVTSREPRIAALQLKATNDGAVGSTPAPLGKRGPASQIDWPRWIAVLYFSVAGFLLARLATGTILARRLVREAAPGGGRLVNHRCASPVTVGWFRPVVLLPSDWQRWPADQLSAVLQHEAEHARWRDPLTQWLATLNRSIFWFHPLAWWLERHLDELAEEACDHAAIVGGADPGAYAFWLVGFARSTRAAGGLMRGVSMPMASALSPRLSRLNSLRGCAAVAPARVTAAVVACGALSLGIAFAAIERRDTAMRADLAPAGLRLSLPVEPKASFVSLQPNPAMHRPKLQMAAANARVDASAIAASRETPPDPAKSAPPAGEYLIYLDLDSIGPWSREGAVAAVKRVLDLGPSVPTSLVVYRGGSLEPRQDFTDPQAVLAATQDAVLAPELSIKGDAGVQALDEVARDFRSDSPTKQILWVTGVSAIADPARHPQIRVYDAALRERGIHLRVAPVYPDSRSLRGLDKGNPADLY